MSKNLELDPKEVLKHLHDLGYRNISQQQLDEFIKDLKKLIKYDSEKKKILRSSRGCDDDTSSTLPNTTDESVAPSPPPPHHSRHCTEEGDKRGEEPSISSSEFSAPASRRVLRECTKRSQERDSQKSGDTLKPPLKPTKSCGCLWRRLGCKCCEENLSKEWQSVKSAKSKENLAPARPKSSFIRTWQMTGQARPGSAPHRNDPVTLYHEYQRHWQQQNIPGENNHNELRWTIRERMLGQDPHPRPLSRASSRSVASVGSRTKRL